MAYDRERHDRERFDRDNRDRDRGTFERAGDEVRSWFGDDEARRRREQDERHNLRGYGADRTYEGDYRSVERDERWRAEPSGERQREYSDRYGRIYSSPTDRTYSPPAERSYSSQSQEFGPEGYGTAGASAWGRGREWRSAESWRVPGPYAGRGPKGYQRSDERIREEVSDRLTAHGRIDASDIEVRVQSGEVTLVGFVDGREVKRAAEDVVEDVPGVREVHNQLRIRSHADDVGAGRTSVLGLTERETQTAATARALDQREGQSDAATRSRARTP